MININKQVYRFLEQPNGDSNMAVDGSTPVEFSTGPLPCENWVINRILVSVRDDGNMSAENFGSQPELENGLLLSARKRNKWVLDLLDGVPIKTNAHWGRFAFDVDVKRWGSGESFLVCRWSFFKAGHPLVLRGRKSESIVLTVQDDLSALESMRIQCQGYQV